MRSCCSTTWSSMLLMTLYTKASSAKSLMEVTESTTDGMSFIYRRNGSGPNTVPCGTPEVTGEYSDFTPSHTTSWRRFTGKDSIQRRTLPWIPYRRSLFRRRLWGTVSKALLKSSIPMSTWRFASRCLSSSWVVRRGCVSGDCHYWKWRLMWQMQTTCRFSYGTNWSPAANSGQWGPWS